MKRPHHVITIPLGDISIRHVQVGVVGVGVVILHAFPDPQICSNFKKRRSEPL
jgi:hypothetical protein